MVKTNKEIRTIRFTDKEWESLRVIAEETGESRTGYIRRHIRQIIKKEESQK